MLTPEVLVADTQALEEAGVVELRDEPMHVIVCLGGLSAHTNGQPIFGCKVYGPFTAKEVEQASRDIRRLEGGAVLVRPLVDLQDTFRRLSAD